MVCEAAPAVQQGSTAGLKAKFEAMKQQAEQEPSSILHFNWDQRQAARAAMNTLVQALADDPVNNYFSGSKRVRFVKDEVKGYLKALPGATHFLATADSQAVALWQLMPHETPRNELWAGWTRILKVPPRLWRQLLRLELHYEKAHEEVASDFGDYYYLSFIGTAPEARGKGYGSLLLRCITERADREGRWCLLEATSERSQALYARHGFVTYEEYRVSKAAPPVFLMKRQPFATAAAAAAGAGLGSKGAGVVGPVALSAAALDLVAAVAAKVAGGPPSSSGPGSDCGSTASSAYISASVVIEDSSSVGGEKGCCGAAAGGVCGEGCGCLQEAKLGRLLDLAECPGLEEEEEAAAAAAAAADGSSEQAGAGGVSSSNQQCETGSSKRAAAGGRTDGCAAEYGPE